MPCIYDDGGESRRKEREECDRVTRLLCFLVGSLDPVLLVTITDRDCPEAEDLCAWHAEHMERDRVRDWAKRRVAEIDAARLQALAKLTPEDRRALGLP